MKLRLAFSIVLAGTVGGCASSALPAWTGAPTLIPSAIGSGSPLPIGSAGESAQLFFAQFGAVPAPFHVHLVSTLSGSTTGTATEEADVDGRSYSAQLHVELTGVAAQDSQVIYVDGTGYVANAGTSDWQAYPDYDTVPPVNPFIDLDATLWTDMGADASHGGNDRVHSAAWRLPSDSASTAELTDVVFDVWLDGVGLPVDGTLAFQLTATAGGPAVGYSASYKFTNVGDPVSIVAPSPAPTATEVAVYTVTSSAFTATGTIPAQYTCDGANTAPPISWAAVPSGTVELALIMDDPDEKGFVHWVVVGIPPTATGIGGGVPLPTGAREGRNDFGKTGYGGPCPPSGTHYYDITLYALSAPSGVTAAPTGDEVERAATGITLGTAVLSATYKRGG